MKIAIYARISTDPQEDSPSPDRQVEDCTRLIEGRGDTVAGVFVDRDLSAWKEGVERPQFQKALDGIAHSAFDGLCVWKLDRLIRRYTDYGPILSLFRDRKATLLSCSDSVDTSNPMGQAIVGFTIAAAETEAANTSLRVTRAMKQMFDERKPHPGGRRHFGYARPEGQGQWIIVSEEAAIAHEVRNRLLAGESIYSVAQDLNKREVWTSSGNHWANSSLRKWIMSPALAGLRTHRISPDGLEREVIEGNWKPIFTIEEWEEITSYLREHSRPNPSARAQKHLLTGILRCGLCQGRMSVGGVQKSDGTKYQLYKCHRLPGNQNCGHVAIGKTSLEGHVIDQALSFLSTAKLRPFGASDDIEELRHKVNEDESALLELNRDRFLLRTMNDQEYRPVHDELRTRLEKAKESLFAMEREQELRMGALAPGDRATLDLWWESASLPERRAFISQAIQEIRVNPASKKSNRIDFSRIELRFNFALYMRAAEEFESTATSEEMALAEADYQSMNEESTDVDYQQMIESTQRTAQ